jgi:thioredoxin reductase
MLGIKLVADEFTEGGLSDDECKEIAARIAQTGLIDYIHAEPGTEPQGIVVPDMTYPAGFAAYLSAGIREVVDVPVVAVKRINDPVLAETLLAEGQADIIGMARALISDPELPVKAREGRLGEIRNCTGSNHCNSTWPVSCIHNPAVGEEERFGAGTLRRASRTKKVLVIGAGPAGLKAAEIAGKRGHEVHLYDRRDTIGGQVSWITQVQSRREFENVIRYLASEIEKVGVQLHVGEGMTVESVLDAGPDAVIVATGALATRAGRRPPHRDGLPGADQSHVVTIGEAFDSPETIGTRVLIVDEFGESDALMTAEFVADQGRDVEIVSSMPMIGDVALRTAYSGDGFLERLVERGIRCTPYTTVTEIDGATVRGTNAFSGGWEAEADTVILNIGKEADEMLYLALKGPVPEVHRAGDCVAPRRIADAIYEGNRAGYAV